MNHLPSPRWLAFVKRKKRFVKRTVYTALGITVVSVWSLTIDGHVQVQRYAEVEVEKKPGMGHNGGPPLNDPIILATVVFLTTGTSSWAVPGDWTATNTVECIGGGAGGSQGEGGGESGDGSGGGAYSKSVNLTGLSGTLTVSIAGTASSAANGADTWFNSASFPTTGQACGAKGGVAGGSDVGGAGGAAASGYAVGTGNIKNSGGTGGVRGTSTGGGGGGGAAAGANGNGGGGGTGSVSGGGGGGGGGNGGSAGTNAPGTSGGGGGAGASGGGSGGAGSNRAAGAPGNGNTGTNFDASHGSGGGGGGDGNASANNGGNGANYGGGGGGSTAGNSGGTGGQGLIVITYTPAAAGKKFQSYIYG